MFFPKFCIVFKTMQCTRMKMSILFDIDFKISAPHYFCGSFPQFYCAVLYCTVRVYSENTTVL